MAWRRSFSPRGTILFRHSDLIDKTKRSANAFRFGLRAGNLTGLVPLSLSSVFETNSVQQRVSVHDAIFCIARESIEEISQITCHLFHPFSTRLGGNAVDLDLLCFQTHREQNEVANDPCKCKHLDGEEVQCSQGLPMGFKKSLPWCTVLSFWCRFGATVIQG